MTATPYRGPAAKPPRPLSQVDAATPPDLEALIWFLHAMRPEIGDGLADIERLVAWAHAMVYEQGGIALIVKGPDKVEASLGLIWENPVLQQGKHLRAVWNCVVPECRNTGHAKSLIARAKVIADGTGRPLYLDEYSPDPEAGKVKLAKRHLVLIGQLFAHLPASV